MMQIMEKDLFNPYSGPSSRTNYVDMYEDISGETLEALRKRLCLRTTLDKLDDEVLAFLETYELTELE